MIFEATPDQIQALSSMELVQLLRRLMHAEAQATGIALRGINVPLQITTADGGEDARVEWCGGNDSTDYFPCRFTVFQSKASKLYPGDWKKEIWTKKSAKKGTPKVLSTAAKSLIDKNGAYVGFCSHPIANAEEKTRRIDAIREGIVEAGAKPDKLSNILIYDGNKIADWVCRHPSVAIWLHELRSGVRLGGFSTLKAWRKRSDICSVPLAADKAKRFSIGVAPRHASHGRHGAQDEALDADRARQRILNFIGEGKRHLRLVGPSGIGKSRFASEIFGHQNDVAANVDEATAVFCKYRDFGTELGVTLRGFVDAGISGLVIVDECPHEEALYLQSIITDEGSNVRLLTIGTEVRELKDENATTISMSAADANLIQEILKNLLPKVDPRNLYYIEELCGGFPRIAVLAAQSYKENEPVLHSIGDVAERILKGCGIKSDSQVRALECLALFAGLRADDISTAAFDLVAERLGRLSGDEMYEHLVHAERFQIVDRSNGAFSVQPIPLARYLGDMRLNALRVATVLEFIKDGTPEVVEAFFEQLENHDGSSTAKSVATNLLSPDGRFDSFEAINSEFGSKCVSALTHVDPDSALYLMERHLSNGSVEKLKEFQIGRRRIVDTLQRLVFRRRTFYRAAPLLLRLAAAEVEKDNFSGSASDSFKQLFQLALSGTEATPTERFMIIDNALEGEDPALISVCVEALTLTLSNHNFMRSAGPEKLGTRPPAHDWYPSTWQDVVDFHRGGLTRLSRVRREFPEHSTRCEKAIAANLRSLLCEPLFEDIRTIAHSIIEAQGVWYEAIQSVGDWLYFDRRKSPDNFGVRVRSFYDELLPNDIIERAILFTRFWQANIRDPEIIYDEKDSSSHGFEYSTRMSINIATEIAKDSALVSHAIQKMLPMDLKNAFHFARELGEKAADSTCATNDAIKAFATSTEQNSISFVCGLLHGIERRDKTLGDSCLRLALEAPALQSYRVNLYAALPMTKDRLQEINLHLREGKLDPRECVSFSYGRGLDRAPSESVLEFIDAVGSSGTPDALWATLEIISMYAHGKPITESLADRVRNSAIEPNLLDSAGSSGREAYHLENLIEKVAESGMVTEDLSRGIAEHVVRLCQSDDTRTIFAFDTGMRKIISVLVRSAPIPLWAVLSSFFETATAWERRKLGDLVGPQDGSFDSRHRNRAGVLFEAPTDIFFDWASKDPTQRAPFLCIFFPVLTNDEESWHPMFEEAVRRFGEDKTFREAIDERLVPNSWSGSIVPLLEVFRGPLERWFDHPIDAVAVWARQTREALERRIERELEREQAS